MKAGCGKTARPVCAADGGEPFSGRLLRPDSAEAGVTPVEGRDLSSRQAQYVVKDLEIGKPINSASVQKLQKALHAKA